MGCGCGKAQAAKKQQFVYTDKSGKQTTYPSEVQARAAQIRNGGGSYQVAASR